MSGWEEELWSGRSDDLPKLIGPVGVFYSTHARFALNVLFLALLLTVRSFSVMNSCPIVR